MKSTREAIEEKLQSEVDDLRKVKRSLEKKLESVEEELADRNVRLWCRWVGFASWLVFIKMEKFFQR